MLFGLATNWAPNFKVEKGAGDQMGGFFNIVVGLAMVAAGLSGRFALIGTNSGVALAVIGGAVAAFGVFRVVKDRSRRRDS